MWRRKDIKFREDVLAEDLQGLPLDEAAMLKVSFKETEHPACNMFH
jgi:hypothetical protein